MSQVSTGGYCATCGQNRMFVKNRINNVLHLILSVLTFGVWAIFVWLPLGIISASRGMRCSVCGMKMGARPVGIAEAPVSPSPAPQWTPTAESTAPAVEPGPTPPAPDAPRHGQLGRPEVPESTEGSKPDAT